MFKHQEAPLCKNGKFCKRRLCQFRHILKCNSCDFASSTSNTLLDHKAQSHEETNSTLVVYFCDLCEFTSNSEDGIKNHKTVKHKNIASTLELIGGQENDSDNLDGDGPYDCNHCEKK